jgi:hypothetical protein
MVKPPDDLAPIGGLTMTCPSCGGVMKSHGSRGTTSPANVAVWYVCEGCGKKLRAVDK